jgi:hypothetical protein
LFFSASGAFIAAVSSTVPAATAALQRGAAIGLAPAGAAYCQPIWRVFATNGTVVDFTMRFYTANVEQGIGNARPLLQRNVPEVVADIGDYDAEAVLAFVGSGNGFVTTWYDQSGNGRNATQTDPTKQPQIVSNGAIITMNGRPTLFFDGNDSMQRTNIGTVFSTPAGFEFQTVVDLVSRATYTSLPITVMNGPASRVVDGYLTAFGGSPNFSYGPGNAFIANAWPTFTAYDVSPVNAPPAIMGYNATSSTAALFQNGVQTALSVTPGTFAQTGITLTIGGRTDTTTSFPGNISEIVGFVGTLSTTDRKILERNQGQHYGITVS